MASTVFASVSTPGPPGPAGPAGPPGYTGVWIVQSGPPSNLIGNNGDMYLNNSTGAGGGDVYGPKASGVWPASTTNIKGAPGTPGAPGYSPTYIVQPANPTAGQGNNGDMAINSSTSDLFGPKTSGAWGPAVANLRGQTGAQGPPGVGYNPRGAWNAGTIYAQGDQVSYNSQLWISLQSSNINNTPNTSPTYWQAVGSGSSQTPWLSAIDGGGFNLGNAGRISVQNSGAVLPDANTNNPAVIVGVTAAGSTAGEITVCGNASSGAMGVLNFANYANATAEKRIALILSSTDGAANSGTLQFMTSSAGAIGERMRITSGGNVGIGTGTPASMLDVYGSSPNMSLRQATAGPEFLTALSASSNNIQWWKDSTPTFAAGIGISSPSSGLTNGNVIISTFNGTAWTDRMVVTNGGSVGIGTSSPPFRFSCHVATDQNIGIASASGRAAFESYNDALSLSEPMGFDASRFDFEGGNVGIGTASPTGPLNVVGPDLTPGTGLGTAQISGGDNLHQVRIGYSKANAYGWIQASDSSVFTNLCLNASGGNVGIGTGAPRNLLSIIPATNPSAFSSQQVAIGENSNTAGYGLQLGFMNLPIGWTSVIQSMVNASPGYLLINPNGAGVRIGGQATPTYSLEVTGDVNCTGVYRINGTPISGGGGGLTSKSVVTGSRAVNTTYNNGTGKPMFVTMTYPLPSSGAYIYLAADTSTPPNTSLAYVTNTSSTTGGTFGLSGWVMPGENYRVNTGTPTTVSSWIEYT